MRHKGKNSGQAMLAELRGHTNDNNVETSKNLPHQTSHNQVETNPSNMIMSTPSSGDSLCSSLCSNRSYSQEKEEPLLVKVRGKSKISLILVFYYVVMTLEKYMFTLCSFVHDGRHFY